MSKFEVTLTLELVSDVIVEEVSIVLRRAIATDAFGLRGTFSANVTKKAPEPVLPAMSVVKTNGLN